MTDYVTLAEIQDYAGSTSSAQSTQMSAAVTIASRAIDYACGRRFDQPTVATDRIFDIIDPLQVFVDDIADPTVSLALSLDDVGYVPYSSVGWYLGPRNVDTQYPEPRPWTSINVRRGGVAFVGFSGYAYMKVTAMFGWPSAVPEPVKRATLIQAFRLVKRSDSPTGIESYADFSRRVSKDMDPDAAALIADFVRADRKMGFA